MSLQIVKYRNYGCTMNGGEKTPDVKGVIIGHDDDVKIQRALSVTNNIEFYKYKVNFKLYQ